MRELQREWDSSGSIAAFDFGAGTVTASNISTSVSIFSGSLTTRPDSLALDYQTAWAFGPIETGSIVSGALTSSWRIENSYSIVTQTGSILLSRENDAGTNWRTALELFEYNGSPLEEIDLTFDQAGRPAVCAERKTIINAATHSIVWLHRFVVSAFVFSSIATGSSPRILLDDPIDISESDVLVFYVKSITSENSDGFIFSTGSGITGDPSTSLCGGDLTMSLQPYVVANSAFRERGNFSSLSGVGASIGITGSFNVGVSSVGATIVDPDFDPNTIKVFDSAGALIDTKVFLSDGIPGAETKDTKIISGNGTPIKSFQLDPAPADYVGYDYIIIEPTSSCNIGTFSTQQVYFRVQRELFATESVVPLVEARFQELLSVIIGSMTASIGTLDPEQASIQGQLFGGNALLPSGLAEGTISGSPCGVLIPNVSQSSLSASMITPRTQFLAGSGSDSVGDVDLMFDGSTATRWEPGGSQANGQKFIINFQATESVGGIYMDIFSDGVPGTFDIATATNSSVFVSRAISISGSDPLVCMFTGSVLATHIKVELRSPHPPPTPDRWRVADVNIFDGIVAFSVSGSLTGSLTGTIDGFVSGAVSGIITHQDDLIGSATGTVSQSLVDGDDFLYELFLEDVVKLTDNRVALYVSRRNIDSGSNDFGEYRVNKFETILFPQRIIGDDVEDQWSASVDLVSGTLTSAIEYTVFDIDAIQSMSLFIPSGSSSLLDAVITHSVFDIDNIQSMSLFIPSGSSSLVDIIITHSVFDIDNIQSMSLFIPSGSSSLVALLLTHSITDKDSFVSYSCDILSGSFETV